MGTANFKVSHPNLFLNKFMSSLCFYPTCYVFLIFISDPINKHLRFNILNFQLFTGLRMIIVSFFAICIFVYSITVLQYNLVCWKSIHTKTLILGQFVHKIISFHGSSPHLSIINAFFKLSIVFKNKMIWRKHYFSFNSIYCCQIWFLILAELVKRSFRILNLFPRRFSDHFEPKV